MAPLILPPAPHSHQSPRSSHQLQRQLWEKGAWGASVPAGRRTLWLREGGRGVEMHCRDQSSQKKRISVFSKSWFLSGLQGKIRRYELPTGRDVFLLQRYFPGLQDSSRFLSASLGLRSKGSHLDVNCTQFSPFTMTRRQYFALQGRAVCDLCISNIWSNTLFIKECSWIEL